MASKNHQMTPINLRMDEARKRVTTIAGITLFAIFLIVSAYAIWFGITQNSGLSKTSGDWGTFGDYVGGLANPIVGLATLLVVVRAYLAQRLELEKTVEALSQSAKEQALMTGISVLRSQVDVKTALLSATLARMKELHGEAQRIASYEYGTKTVLSIDGEAVSGLNGRQKVLEENYLPAMRTIRDEVRKLEEELSALAQQIIETGGDNPTRPSVHRED